MSLKGLATKWAAALGPKASLVQEMALLQAGKMGGEEFPPAFGSKEMPGSLRQSAAPVQRTPGR